MRTYTPGPGIHQEIRFTHILLLRCILHTSAYILCITTLYSTAEQYMHTAVAKNDAIILYSKQFVSKKNNSGGGSQGFSGCVSLSGRKPSSRLILSSETKRKLYSRSG